MWILQGPEKTFRPIAGSVKTVGRATRADDPRASRQRRRRPSIERATSTRIVVLKRMKVPPGADRAHLQHRFLREAKSMAAINSDFVARLSVANSQSLQARTRERIE
jgi:hypothetical protein